MNINKILKEMTVEEKTKLCNGYSFFGMYYNDDLNIPRLQLLDGGTGINFEQLFGDNFNELVGSTTLVNVINNFYNESKLNEEEKKLHIRIKEKVFNKRNINMAPGCYPPGILLGATWNKDVIRKVGEVLGYEARLFGVNVLLGTPNINIHRDPLNGRLFEGFSEDPYLVSSLAPAMVKGVQSKGVAANIKHFAANNLEINRVGINEIIPIRALREIYFPGFLACVRDGKVATIMSAYNGINGEFCSQNKWLLEDVLRNEWGFLGVVISDWGAVYDEVKAFLAGNDIKMPGPSDNSKMLEAYNRGEISDVELDNSVIRILELIDKYKTNNPQRNSNNDMNNSEYISVNEVIKMGDEVAYTSAVEGIILLKNENVFPIKSGSVSLFGNGAKRFIESGSGSAGITTNRTTSLIKCLESELGEEKVLYETITKATQLVVYIATVPGMEGNDRENLKLMQEDYAIIKKLVKEKSIKKYKLAVVLNTCGPVDVEEFIDDIEGLFAVFLPGMAGGEALSHIMTGKVNPSGKLPITFPIKYEDTPTFISYPDGYKVYYGEGIYVGYRYYNKKKIKPRFAFGYGLSYSDFVITNVEIRGGNNNNNNNNNMITFDRKNNIIYVNITIENTSDIMGQEVVQIYVNDQYSTLNKPIAELKGFKKVFIDKRSKKEVEIEIDINSLSSFDEDINEWVLEEGIYNIMVGNSSLIVEQFSEGSIPPNNLKPIFIDIKSQYSYGKNTTIKEIYENKELYKITETTFINNGWDFGIIKNNYQYTSNRRIEKVLSESFPDVVFCDYYNSLSKVIKY